MRLINADEITDHEIIDYLGIRYASCLPDIRDLLNEQPTIEAVPVVHAEWKLKQGDEGVHWYCSKCREEALFDIFNYQEKSNFCPNCGADMRKGGANQ